MPIKNSKINRSINRSLATPLYQQIKDQIKQNINQSVWQAGDKIPSENELVASMGVSRMTVHRALAELTREGLLKRVHGMGTYVSSKSQHASLIQLKDIAEEIAQRGQQHSSEVLSHLKIKMNRAVANKMQQDLDSEVYFLKAVHYQDNVPVQLEQRYVNPELMPDFMSQDFNLLTATRYLIGKFRPDQMEHRVQAIAADSSVAENLQMPINQPCLKLSRRTWKNDQVVTYATMIYPGDRYDLLARYSTSEVQLVNQ